MTSHRPTRHAPRRTQDAAFRPGRSARSRRGVARILPAFGLLAAVTALVVLVTTVVPPTSGAFLGAIDGTREVASSSSDFGARTLPLRSAFAGGDAGWATSNGCWRTSVHNGFGIDADECDHGGDAISLNGSPSWTDVTMQADVKIDSGTEAGLLVRVADPTATAASVSGYGVTIDTTSTLRIARQDGTGTVPLATASIVSGVSPNTWYHLVVAVRGCSVTAWQTTVGANTWTRTSVTDPGCRTSGAVGLLDRGSRAAWRFVTVTSGATTDAGPAPFNTVFATGATGGATTGGAFTVDQAAEALSGTDGSALRFPDPRTDGTLTTAVRFDSAPGPGSALGATVDDGATTVRAVLDGSSLRLDVADAGAGPGSDWSTAVRRPLARPVGSGMWWHLTMARAGCRTSATVSPSDGGTSATVSVTTSAPCGAPARIGLIVSGAAGSWRETAATSA